MTRSIGLVILFQLVFLAVAFSQNSQCGTEQRHKWMMQNNSQYHDDYIAIQRQMQSQETNISDYGYRSGINKIPVVVHVIHLGEPEGTGSNISDQQIIEAINGLNDRWRNYIGHGVDMTIEFCLARVDPNGNPTNGIARVDGSGVPNYMQYGLQSNPFPGADEIAIKDLSRWPRADYYNIWVVHNINGGVAGYAYYPTFYAYEGTVAQANSMRYNSSLLAHELGHAFNLRHTFEGDNDGNSCPANSNCATDGDQICDTPPHKRADCGSSNPCTTSGVFDNSVRNYMSYCNSTNRFTSDQQIKALAAAISNARSSLINNNYVCACATTGDCDDKNPCTLDSCVNGSCQNIIMENCVIASFPACEDFQNFNLCNTNCGQACELTNGWGNLNTDDMDWISHAGGTFSSNTGPEADHSLGTSTGRYLYTEASSDCNPGKSAIVTSPSYDLRQAANSSIEFWYHMYGNQVGSLSLQVEVPFGSGSWSPIFSASGNQGNAWHNASVDLNAYTGNIVRFRFTGVSGQGFQSDIALDDVCVHASALTCFDNIISKDTMLCEGYSLLVNGNYITSPGTYYDTIAKTNGCDSIIVITLNYLSNFTVSLEAGWNMISSFVHPSQSDMLDLFSPVSSDIIIIKNMSGQSSIPSHGINTIGEWDITQGYKVQSLSNTSLTLGCEQINLVNTPIHLGIGWSMIPYFGTSAMNTVSALSSLNPSDIIMIKNIQGASYIPDLAINTIGDMMPGQGYLIKMTNPGTLYYPTAPKTSSDEYFQEYRLPVHYLISKNTGENATIIIPQGSVQDITHGDEIGVFQEDGTLAGAAVYEDRHLALTVWGDDESTGNIKQGLGELEKYYFKVWNHNTNTEFGLEVTYAEGTGHYTQNGISVFKSATPRKTLDPDIKIYPNPTNGQFHIEFFLAEREHVSIRIFNIHGKKMVTLENRYFEIGRNNLTLNLEQLPPGIYLCEFRSANTTKAIRMEKL